MHQQKPCKANKSLSIETTTLYCEAIKKNLKRVIKTNTINLIKTPHTRMIVYIATASAVVRPAQLKEKNKLIHQSKAQETFITLP